MKNNENLCILLGNDVVVVVVEHAKEKVGLPLDEKMRLYGYKDNEIGCDPTSCTVVRFVKWGQQPKQSCH